MKFMSTRGRSPGATFREAVFSGVPPDDGLYVPESFPRFPGEFIESLTSQSLQSIGEEVARTFIDDLPRAELSAIVKKAWTFPIPLTHLDENLFLLELFHGPTLAFKDVGARFLAQVLSAYLHRSEQEIAIAVATSGDTGSAVAHAFYEVPHITVYVLYPSGKISKLQEQQMTTLGRNIHALEVEGTFDDCQRIVKEALADAEVVRARNLTTANSMNIGRLIPQVVYYVWGIAQWLKMIGGRSEASEAAPTIVVPSGNFGNLTAAVYARATGTPIGKLVAATNANDVVPQYFQTGNFIARASVQTLSNAMDVGNPSNVARLEAFFGSDLREMRSLISAVSISDNQTLEEIRRTYEGTGVILDPHTAVGVAAARQQKKADPVIIAATAHPGKFPEVIERALGLHIPIPDTLQDALRRPKKSVRVPADYGVVRKVLLGGPQ